MIDASHRFHGRGSLRFVYQQGKTARGTYSSLKYIANKRRATYRMAVVVSRKVHKSAVVRNRIRRRIYEIVRVHSSDITAPYDMIFTAHSEQLATLEPAELQEQILSQLRSAGIMPREEIRGMV